MLFRTLYGITTAFFVFKEKLSGIPFTDICDLAVKKEQSKMKNRRRILNI